MTSSAIPFNAGVYAHLEAMGVDLPRAMRMARIAPDAFMSGNRARITTRQFFDLWNAIRAHTDDPALGLRLGADLSPHQYDVASIVALHSANLGEALAKVARYKRLVCPEEVTLETRGREARLQFRWTLLDEPSPVLVTDGTFARALAMARHGIGRDVVPRRVELTRRPAHEALLTRHFGCKIRFNAPLDLLVFDADVLTEPFVTHNGEMVDMMLPGLEKALAAHVATPTLAERVGALLYREMQGQRPSIDTIAKALFISPRTLQRRLEQEGTSYQRVLDQARKESARRLLRSTDLDAGEIAFLLGFEELNSFTRAFQGWEGTTPTRWRDGARH